MSSQCTERIKVFARIRPSNEEGVRKVVHIEDNCLTINQNDDSKSFQFDGLFGEDSNQKQIFDGAASNIVHGALQGYNGTIFAYGQTGAGKTHTMIGPSSNFDEESGIIPRGLHLLFEQLDKKKEEMPDNFSSQITISFVEIYNELIHDLFVINDEKLKIGQDHDGNVIVKGATEIFVKDLNDAMEEVRRGWNNRSVGETAMNRHSSRSHALLLIKIHTEEVHGENSKDRISTARSAFLNLVDLAGSERISQSKVEGERLKETANINKSLLTLKIVIRELSEQKKNGFIAFRNSVLTHILKDSLGGNARTAVMINVHPDKKYYNETLSTLQFSAEVRRIENKVVVNEDLKGESVNAYKAEIRRLQEETEKILNKCTLEKKDLLVQLEVERKEKMELQEKLKRFTDVNGLSTLLSTPCGRKERRLTRFTPARDKQNHFFLPVMDVNGENGEDGEDPLVVEEKELQLKSEISSHKQIIDEKTQECAGLLRLLEGAEKRISEVETNLTNTLASTVKDLTIEMEKAKKTIEEEKEKYILLQKHSTEVEGQLLEANGQVERLQSVMEMMKSIHVDEIEARERYWKCSISDKEKKEVDLKREIDGLNVQVELLMVDLMNNETEKKAAEDDLSLLRDRVSKAEKENSAKIEELELITTQMDELREAVENERKEQRKSSVDDNMARLMPKDSPMTEIKILDIEMEREKKDQEMAISSSGQLKKLPLQMSLIGKKSNELRRWESIADLAPSIIQSMKIPEKIVTPPVQELMSFRMRVRRVSRFHYEKELIHRSEPKKCCGVEWAVLVGTFSEEIKGVMRNYLSIGIAIVDYFPATWTWSVSDKCHLHSQEQGEMYSKEKSSTLFNKEKPQWGHLQFIDFEKLFRPEYVKDDSIVITVELVVSPHQLHE